MEETLTEAEVRYFATVVSKDAALRALLSNRQPGVDPLAMFNYLVTVKNTLGNLNNDISFVASLLVSTRSAPASTRTSDLSAPKPPRMRYRLPIIITIVAQVCKRFSPVPYLRRGDLGRYRAYHPHHQLL